MRLRLLGELKAHTHMYVCLYMCACMQDEAQQSCANIFVWALVDIKRLEGFQKQTLKNLLENMK